jgi:hypothetical protein
VYLIAEVIFEDMPARPDGAHLVLAQHVLMRERVATIDALMATRKNKATFDLATAVTSALKLS